MADLKEISDRLGAAFAKKSRNQWIASLAAKIMFAVFSTISVIAQFTGEQNFTASNYVGIGSAAVAVLGAIFIAVAEKDSSDELEIARQAVVAAQDERQALQQAIWEYADIDEFNNEQIRAKELYQAVNTMRGVIEATIHEDYVPVQRSISILLETASRSLDIAIGYRTAEHHTLCVYQTMQADNGDKYLQCIAQSRTVPCNIDDARRWPSGVGVAGAALARGTEVVVPDMNALQIGTLYADLVKNEDAERYRSIAAVPILAHGHGSAWGVVVGTSDQANHFEVGPDHTGVQTVEAVRALAGMAALAVRTDQLRVSCGHTPSEAHRNG
ncbi:GAF domain-containing protein [Methylorubrum sp. SB2]|uniref:GAF domain-containing protein n=1 Tax=Methylorubrum subtropicum TaxID=3138812 RepID=UPI00313C4A31